MKRIYVTREGLHWASNGSRIAGLSEVHYEFADARGWIEVTLSQHGKRPIQVRVVDCPKNRCKNCGEKQ